MGDDALLLILRQTEPEWVAPYRSIILTGWIRLRICSRDGAVSRITGFNRWCLNDLFDKAL